MSEQQLPPTYFTVNVDEEYQQGSLESGGEWYDGKAAEIAHDICENPQFIGHYFVFFADGTDDKVVMFNSFEHEGDDYVAALRVVNSDHWNQKVKEEVAQ